MAFRVFAALVAAYNWIASFTAIGMGLLLIFWHEPLMQWLWTPVIVGVYVLMIGAMISAPIRIRRWSNELRRGFPIEPIKSTPVPPENPDISN